MGEAVTKLELVAFGGVIVHRAPAAALMADGAIQERYCSV